MGVLNGAVHVYQALVGVVDHAADVRVGLPQSEEHRAAAHEGFHIRFHFGKITRQ